MTARLISTSNVAEDLGIPAPELIILKMQVCSLLNIRNAELTELIHDGLFPAPDGNTHHRLRTQYYQAETVAEWLKANQREVLVPLVAKMAQWNLLKITTGNIAAQILSGIVEEAKREIESAFSLSVLRSEAGLGAVLDGGDA